MKERFLAVMTATAMAVLGSSVFSRLIERPVFEKSSEMNLSVDRIELSDSATDVGLTVYTLPGRWISFDKGIYLRGTVTGEKYPLLGAIGAEPGKKTYANDSCYLEVTLRFPPVKAEETSVDFIEPEGWTILGLSLDETKPSARFTTRLHGTFKDSPRDSWLILTPGGEDFRITNNVVIPVRDGKFEYELPSDEILAFNLIRGTEIQNGSWYNNIFFSEGGDVEMTFPTGGADEGADVKGGKITSRYQQLKKDANDYWDRNVAQSDITARIRKMQETGDFFTKEFRALDERMRTPGISGRERDSLRMEYRKLNDEKRIMSPEGAEIRAKYDSLASKFSFSIIFDIYSGRELPDLYEIKKEVEMGHHVPEYLEFFSRNFSDTLADHPYHKELTRLMKDNEPVVGNRFIDVEAPDLQGNSVRISDIIRGKVAVIDLWASWCGPCRRHSKGLIPLYEKYRSRGFEVIGIARESGTTEAMEKAIAKDGYPWLNLVELDDRNGIWKRYRAANGGGKIIMVDSEGKIIAVDPDAEEISSHLSTLLGE